MQDFEGGIRNKKRDGLGTQRKASEMLIVKKCKYLILRLGHLYSSYHPLYLLVVRRVRLRFVYGDNWVRLSLYKVVIATLSPILIPATFALTSVH